MGIKKCIILSMISIVLLFPVFSSAVADDIDSVEIHMLGEQSRTRFNSPVIVAGIWHYIKITSEEQTFQTITIKLYKGSSIPSAGNQDESTYYEWKYDSTALEKWTDLREYDGYSYINSTNCEITDNTYAFCVGIKHTFPNVAGYCENWTLDIYADGDEAYSTNVVIETPTSGLSKSHHDTITFRVDPFTETDTTNEEEYFIVGNTGNLPLIITIDYGADNQLFGFDVTNSSSKLSPGNSFNHFVTLHAEPSKAGIFTVTGEGKVTEKIPDNLIITTAPITLPISKSVNAAKLEVSVGYSNYKIQAISNTSIIFQYPESLEMYEGQERDIKVYFSGEGTAELEIWADEINVEILSISAKDQTGHSLTITSTDTSEYAVTIRVRALRENKVGEITYQLETDGRYNIYTTEITISAPQQEDGEVASIPASTVIIGLIIIIVVIYMISIQIRHRRR